MKLSLELIIIKHKYASSKFFEKYKIFELILINTFLIPLLLGFFFGVNSGVNYFIYLSIVFPITVFSFILFFIYSDYLHYNRLNRSMTPRAMFEIEFMERIKKEQASTIEKYKERAEIFHNSIHMLFLLQACGGIGFIVINKLIIK